ncbi:MAG: DUF898 family protein, partial [Erysipelotrichaceae bacterium]|nr:DUF898 family protein [Erysipelotrichaceae bacterium]
IEKKNIEKFSVYVGLASIGVTIIYTIIHFISNFIYNLYRFTYFRLFGTVSYLILWVGKIVAILGVIGCVAVAIGLIYRCFAYDEKENEMFLAIGCSILSALGCTAPFLGKSMYFFSVCALLLSVDLFVKVIVLDVGLTGSPNIDQDLRVISSVWRNFQELNKSSKPAPSRPTPGPSSSQYRPASAYSPGPQPSMVYGEGDSYFDGDGLSLLGYVLLTILLSVFTCGLAAPWGITKIYNWRVSHTVINGKRQVFNGTAMELFGHWIKWYIFTLLTFGIYSYFANWDLKKWVVSRTSYDNEEFAIESRFEGDAFEYLGHNLINGILVLLTCGIYGAWGACSLETWYDSKTIVCGHRYYFDGKGSEYFVTCLWTALLTIVTCGIFFPWASCIQNRYIFSHTHEQY